MMYSFRFWRVWGSLFFVLGRFGEFESRLTSFCIVGVGDGLLLGCSRFFECISLGSSYGSGLPFSSVLWMLGRRMQREAWMTIGCAILEFKSSE